MTFVTAGLAIAGLAAMTIPIVIHLLFRQRRKPVEWAAMRFLMEAFRKHRRRLQLEQFLLLATRCLILGLLGVALARPILHSTGLLDSGSSRVVYLVIDNSMTAGAVDESGVTALQRHVNSAVETIDSLGTSDAVALITAAQPVRTVLNPPSTDHTGVVRLLRSLEPTQTPADLPGAMSALRSAIDASARPEEQVLVYLLSDFRAGSADLDAPPGASLNDLPENVQLMASPPDERPLPNVQITSIDPVRSVVLPGAADGSGQVTVRLARHGGVLDAQSSRVRLELGASAMTQSDVVRWQPGQSEASADFLLNIPVTEDRELRLTASIDHDQLEADDQRYAVLTLRDRVGVLLVDRRSFLSDRTIESLSAGQWVRRALEPAQESPMQFIEVEPGAMSAADLRGTDVMVLARPDLLERAGWELVRQFVQQGGLLVLMPPGDARVHQWTASLEEHLSLPWQIQLEIVEHQPPLFFADEQPRDPMLRMLSGDLSDLLLPASMYRTLPVLDTGGAGRMLLVLADGSPAVLAGSPGSHDSGDATEAAAGMVILFTFAPELSWTNIPTKPLMVPLFQELVRQGLSQIRAARQATVGMQSRGGFPPAASNLALGEQRIAVLESGSLEQPLDDAGLYTIEDRAQQPIGTLAVNVEPSAGRTQTQTPAAVQAWLRASGPWQFHDSANVVAALEVVNRGSPIARNLLLIVLALIVAETVMARLFSHSRASRSAGGAVIAASADQSRHSGTPLGVPVSGGTS